MDFLTSKYIYFYWFTNNVSKQPKMGDVVRFVHKNNDVLLCMMHKAITVA